MKFLLVLSFSIIQLLNTYKSFAQINDASTISVIPHSSFNIFYSDINEMGKDKIISRALEVKIAPDMPSADVYVSIVSSDVLNKNTLGGVGIILNAQNIFRVSSSNTNEILLSAIPVKIFSYIKLQNNDMTSLFFDIIYHGYDHFVAPGEYKFSVIFSQIPL